MANSIAINPLVIDTPGAGDILAASAPIRIQSIQWDPGLAVATGDRAVVTDTAGNSIYEATIVTGLLVGSVNPVQFPDGGLPYKGLKVPTLTHGKIFIYLALPV